MCICNTLRRHTGSQLTQPKNGIANTAVKNLAHFGIFVHRVRAQEILYPIVETDDNLIYVRSQIDVRWIAVQESCAGNDASLSETSLSLASGRSSRQ